MSVIDDLRSLPPGEKVRAQTDEGEAYTFRVVDASDYVYPDEYGADHLVVPTEFERDVDAPVRRWGGRSSSRPAVTCRTVDW